MKVNTLFIVNFALAVAGSLRCADGETSGDVPNAAAAVVWGQQERIDRVGDIRNGIDNQNNKTSCVHSYYHKAFDHYSKIVFLDEDLEAALLPIEDYPLDESMGDILKTQSMASAPMTAADIPEIDANELIRQIGGIPAFPGEQVFWDELMQVALFQAQRMLNAKPPFRLPEIWRGFDIEEVAQAVHNEFPGYWHQKLLEGFWAKGLHMDYSIVPFHSNVDFVGTTVRLAALNTWAVDVVCPPNFLLKWTVGKLRPEEAAFQITKNLMEGVPQPLKSLIDWMNLTTPEQFTAYPEGSPSHPSWPAMHSAASAASLWLATVADLNDQQYCQVLLTDYAIAFARSVAGVHYSSDNVAGLNLGQHLVAAALPEHLAKMYNANKTAVEEKIARLRFDWENFDPTSCAIALGN